MFCVSLFLCEARTNETKTKEVKEGGSVTLESGVTEIQKDDNILWKFALEDRSIAAIQGGKKKTPPFGAGWRYKCRLKLDENGSLIIKNIRPMDNGFYVLQIIRSGHTSLKLFKVNVESRKRFNVSKSNLYLSV